MRDRVKESTDAAEAYLAGASLEVGAWWGRLPDGVDPGLVERVLAKHYWHHTGDPDPKLSFPWRTNVVDLVNRKHNATYVDAVIAFISRHPEWPEAWAVRAVPAGTPGERDAALKDLLRKTSMVGRSDADVRLPRVLDYAQDARFVAVVREILTHCPLDWLTHPFLYGYIGVLRTEGSPESKAVISMLRRRAIAGDPHMQSVLRGMGYAT